MDDTNLKKYRAKFERLRHCLTDLQTDVADAGNNRKIYYAIDFSELYSYLNQYSAKSFNALGVALEPSDKVTTSRQHRLALEHLFNSLSDKLFILPPYVIEMWAYSKNRTGLEDHYFALRGDAQNLLAGLDASQLEFLQRLESGSVLSEDEKKKLLEIVKHEFEAICAEATSFVAWRHQAVNLKNLLQTKKISTEMDEILPDSETAPPFQPNLQEEAEVFQCFPKNVRHKYYQKRIDSRAIIYLRKINETLSKRSEKLLLITRDSSMREAVEELSRNDVHYPQLAAYLRDPETVFFDLILQGKPTEKKLDWLNESVNELRNIEDQLVEIINVSHHSDRTRLNYPLAEPKEAVLKNTFKGWDERINIQLSLASKTVEWLGGRAEIELPAEGDDPEIQTKITSIKNLFAFIKSSESFETDAISEVRKIWQDITYESLRIKFLDLFKPVALESIGNVLADRLFDSRTVSFLLPPSASIMPFIKFTSEVYEQRLEEFRKNNKINRSKNDLRNLIVEATTGIAEPEDFLFMAFILGILELWKESHQMIEEVLTFDPVKLEKNNFDLSQAYYFRGFIRRKKGERSDDLSYEIIHYEYAFYDIQTALEEKREDPRYLKEYGAIVLFYEESWRLLERSEDYRYNILSIRGRNKDLNLECAKEYLRKGWEIQKDRYMLSDDTRLKIEILNNIVYAEVISENPNFETTEPLLSRMKVELEKIEDPNVSQGIVPFVRDTEIMWEAKKVFLSGDETALQSCLAELKKLPNEYELNEYRKRANQEHQSLILDWLSQTKAKIKCK